MIQRAFRLGNIGIFVCEHCGNIVEMVKDKGVQRKILKPEQAPKAEFMLTDGENVEAVYAYCNLHGLWKA